MEENTYVGITLISVYVNGTQSKLLTTILFSD
jgi:hypothetical protein